MIRVTLTDKTGENQTHFFEGSSLTVGRLRHNDLVLQKTNVSKRHVKIVWKNQQFTVIDLRSTNGTFVNGKRVTVPTTVGADDVIHVGDYTINVALEQDPDAHRPAAPPKHSDDTNTPEVLDSFDEGAETISKVPDGFEDPFAEFLAANEGNAPEEHVQEKEPTEKAKKGVASTMSLGSLSEDDRSAIDAAIEDVREKANKSKAKEEPKEEVVEEPEEEVAEEPDAAPQGGKKSAAKESFKLTKGLDGIAIGPEFRDPEAEDLEIDPERLAADFEEDDNPLTRIFSEAQSATARSRQLMLMARFDGEQEQAEDFRKKIAERVTTVFHAFKEAGVLPKSFNRKSHEHEICRAMEGLGPIDDLLSDESVGEIQVHGADQIYVVKNGKLIRSDAAFLGEPGLALALQSLHALSDSNVDDYEMVVHGTIDNAAQFSMLSGALAAKAPSIRITRLGYETDEVSERLADLVKGKHLSPATASAIDDAVQGGRGVIVVGVSATVRTRLLGAVVSEISEGMTACSFASAPPATHCPTAQLDRRALTTGDGLLSEILHSLQPDYVVVPELQYHELCGPNGLLYALAERGVLQGSAYAQNGQDFLRRVERSLTLAFPGLSEGARSQFIHDAFSVVVETPSTLDGKKGQVCNVLSLEVEGDTLLLSPIAPD